MNDLPKGCTYYTQTAAYAAHSADRYILIPVSSGSLERRCLTLGLRFDKHKRRHRTLHRLFCAAFVCAVSAAVSLYVLKVRGLFFEDSPDKFSYPCRGIYVTEKTGEIDWAAMPGDSIDFCYIRLTRGIAFADCRGAVNRTGALKSGLLVGYVHDFDFSADGKLQADNFLNSAGELKGRLLPAVDIRMSFYEKLVHRDISECAKRINAFAARIKEVCGCGAVLLCDKDSYETFNVGDSVALAWAEGSVDDCYADDWSILSYSETGRSAAFADSSARCTMLTGGFCVDRQAFADAFVIRK